MEKLLGALAGAEKEDADETDVDEDDSNNDVEEGSSDDAMLMGLLGALSSGSKKGGQSMEKLLGALAGAEKEDADEADVDEDEGEDENQDVSANGAGAANQDAKNLHHDLRKVLRVARKTR